RLPSLLGTMTAMPVVEITDGVLLQPNQVYVLPPGKDLYIARNVLRLRDRQLRGGSDGLINEFFTSLASSCGDRAIAVVLSGTGTDGTLGLRDVKEHGGLTFAEAHSTARFFGMPQSAINSGAVDEVLTPAEIA